MPRTYCSTRQTLDPGELDNAIRLLSTAAETGKRADIVAATDAVERVLRDRRLL